jgi:hypothetical protein
LLSSTALAFDQTERTSAAGLPLSATFQAGSTSAGVSATTELEILGVALQALQAIESPPNTIDGVTYTEFYAFGLRVLSQSITVQSAGLDQLSIGLAPAEVRVPIVTYPIGPILLELDGGVRFQADLNAQLIPQLAIPASLSRLGLQLKVQADAAGFIEGDVSLLVVRAGVGGQVDLVDAQADVNATFAFDGSPPVESVSAMADFLSGKFYAFLDYFSLAHFGWKRLLDYTLFQWKGFCFAAGALQCP